MKHVLRWVIPLVVAMIGIGLAAFFLLGDDPSPGGTAFHPPQPSPLVTTPVPTLTPIPLLNTVIPAIDLTTLEGDPLILRDAEGKALILNFWASWCVPCRTEMPTLAHFAQQNEDTVTVLAVTDPEDGQTQQAIFDFLSEYDLDSLTIALDEGGLLREHFLVEALPITYVIDAAGIVRFRHVGEVTENDLADYVSRLEVFTHEHTSE
jgi:thiol-disulfide isomerase/thioredoxin